MTRRHGTTPGDVHPRWTVVEIPRPSTGHSCPSFPFSAASSSADVFFITGLFRVGMTASFSSHTVTSRWLGATPRVCWMFESSRYYRASCRCTAGGRRRIPLLRPGTSRSLFLSAVSWWLITSSQKIVTAFLFSSQARSALITAAGDNLMTALSAQRLFSKASHASSACCAESRSAL